MTGGLYLGSGFLSMSGTVSEGLKGASVGPAMSRTRARDRSVSRGARGSWPEGLKSGLKSKKTELLYRIETKEKSYRT